MSSAVTRADVCVAACGDAWRGDGAILASPMGVIPVLGARLARRTFALELLMTDGEAYLVDEDGDVEGWLPYRQVFTMVAAGRRHVMMGAAQIDRFGQPEHLLHRRLGAAEGAAPRRARRAWQHRQPRRELLGAAAFSAGLR
jgi:hypothetical protein